MVLMSSSYRSGSGYEWEHGARVRNCTQLHWSLDAAVPRVRRQELIPRAKLKPAIHQNMQASRLCRPSCQLSRQSRAKPTLDLQHSERLTAQEQRTADIVRHKRLENEFILETYRNTAKGINYVHKQETRYKLLWKVVTVNIFSVGVLPHLPLYRLALDMPHHNQYYTLTCVSQSPYGKISYHMTPNLLPDIICTSLISSSYPSTALPWTCRTTTNITH
ncbi:hypothetical protein J6590_003309 [Homalodisca vitripennis]|nr:hypothetical protein J6590_003309 [Homalodisca vitripennis]